MSLESTEARGISSDLKAGEGSMEEEAFEKNFAKE